NISGKTVDSHLVACFKAGKKLDLDRLGFTKDKYELIKKTINGMKNVSMLRFIKQKLP
ncbi:MAG: hypothetical protein GTN36_05380, partial [Candidatus Aenigmarchaeota archaeon]|nr:hypothetical protein [Candidatus Aenigmarchaeota archaeon]